MFVAIPNNCVLNVTDYEKSTRYFLKNDGNIFQFSRLFWGGFEPQNHPLVTPVNICIVDENTTNLQKCGKVCFSLKQFILFINC